VFTLGLGLSEARKRFKVLILICLLLVVTLSAFIPSLKNGFTNWDDDILLTGNKLIRNLSWQGLREVFTTPFYGLYHPLVLVSYALEYHFFKLNPLAYHTTNLTLHLINCLLVFWLISLIGADAQIAFITAMLFAIHPIHVESVAWVSERKDVLYALFFLSSLIGYASYLKNHKIKYYCISLFAFFFSLLSKSMAVTLPFLLFLCDYLLKKRLDKRCLIEKAPFFILGLVFGIINIYAKCSTGAVTQEPWVSFNNFLAANHRLVFYLLRTIFPVNLFYLYQHHFNTAGLLPIIFWFSPIIVLILIMTVVFLSRYSRKITFGSMFFLVTILPTLPLMNVGYAADRYTYIPLIGLFYLFGEGFAWLSKNIKRIKLFLYLFLVIIMGLLFALTWQRCKVWKDSLSLWDDALKYNPAHPLLFVKRGIAYADKGLYDSAISDYNKALGINPNLVEAYYDRGITYSQKGEFDNAISDYTRAVSLNPNFSAAYINRGVAYAKKGEYDKSLSDYNRAIEINRDYPEAYYYRALSYFSKKEYDKAWQDLRMSRRLGYKIDPYFLQLFRDSYGKDLSLP